MREYLAFVSVISVVRNGQKYCQHSDQKVRRVLILRWLLISIEAISRPIWGINFQSLPVLIVLLWAAMSALILALFDESKLCLIARCRSRL